MNSQQLLDRLYLVCQPNLVSRQAFEKVIAKTVTQALVENQEALSVFLEHRRLLSNQNHYQAAT